jgi:hypothetical protein
VADTNPEPRESGAVAAALKALGTILGVHIQYAQQEAASDLGRVVTGVVLLVLGGLFALVALLVAHAALVFHLSRVLPTTVVGAALIVAAGDVLLVVVLALAGRARLRRPIMQQTRTLVRRTVTSLVEM